MKNLIYKSGILLMLIMTISYTGMAQQSFRFSQFFQNTITFNPAISGSEEFIDLKIGYRQQWSGLNDAPQTYYISAHAPLQGKKEKRYGFQNNSLRISDPSMYERLGTSRSAGNAISHGIGGYIVNDTQGIFGQTSGMLTYALHYNMGQSVLSFGVGGGVNSRQLDLEGITVGNNEIPDATYQAYLAQEGRITNIDMNVGIFLRHENYYIGYSAKRLLQNELFANISAIGASEEIEHYGIVGLRFNVNNTLLITPGAFVKYTANAPVLYDINVRVKYEELLWLGASYRNTETVIAMAGLSLNNLVNLGYSYDLGIGDINDFRSGTHEIGLGFMLFNKKDTSPYMW
ncbi:PorP/SprF family type IX secretion system membrane protein [Catalinimonas niigatensis]|uniref:PorP/SprF family type IX secretion system membrane protein n=1 Tax=Catalinimonas niigatensis TaxID=1397264 RepID=UPI0026662D61|nr:type IX secretion system membrane protein PorP/SprF [Catalinimonas niigatensis]WPP50131.1 type IX secretion system membrane protein PorP/SprF [Catalinimonas niigatensis]